VKSVTGPSVPLASVAVAQWCYDYRLVEERGGIMDKYLELSTPTLGLLVFITSLAVNLPVRSIHITNVRSSGARDLRKNEGSA
jgi:hypothetical protein